MTAIVACALEIPMLAEAAQARGLRLVPAHYAERRNAHAALFALDGRDPIARVAEVRAAGWHMQLMLVLDADSPASVACALDAGADDAVAMPASAGEIAARLAARLRSRTGAISIGPLRIDPMDRSVTRDGQPIMLLPREYALLLHLARAGGRCVSRAELLREVWGLGFDPGTNVVEVHVSRLRARLDRGHAAPLLITHKGRGYRLTSNGEPAYAEAQVQG